MARGGRGSLGSTIRTLRTDWHGMQKDWNALVRAVMEEVGEMWLIQFMPLHFKPGARSRYGYKRRSDYWNEKKKAMFGDAIDLVFTGDMRNALLSYQGVRVVARATRNKASVRVKMPIPHPLNAKAGKGEMARLDLAGAEETAMIQFAIKLLRKSIVDKVLRQKVMERAAA